jgi:hypothetical protein
LGHYHKFHRIRQSIVTPLEGIFIAIASEAAWIPLPTDVHRLGQLSWLLLLLVIVTMPNWGIFVNFCQLSFLLYWNF